MIRLDLKREPYWLDLGHGVRVHVRPCTTALVMAARAAAARERMDTVPESEAVIGARTAALVKALARFAIDEWEGIGDAEDKPASVTPEGIDALMDLWPIAEGFERQYLGPALLLDVEKNV
jgi:hypothetical protein